MTADQYPKYTILAELDEVYIKNSTSSTHPWRSTSGKQISNDLIDRFLMEGDLLLLRLGSGLEEDAVL